VLRGAVVTSAVVLGGWLAPSVNSASAASTDTFSISGDAVGPLAPGVTQPLELRLANLVDRTLNLQTLEVTVTGVRPAQGGTCSPADFRVQQAILGTIALPAGVSNLLSAPAPGLLQAPQLTMLDTAANQDGCKNAVVDLQYAGTALDPDGDLSHGHGDNGPADGSADGGGRIADAHADLPSTGAGPGSWWAGLAGLVLAAAGATTVRIVRREKGYRS
jgi:hypothetical protein